MAELKLDVDSVDADHVVFLEPDAADGVMTFYLAGAGTGYLTNDQRRELITWLAEHTENPPCILGCR